MDNTYNRKWMYGDSNNKPLTPSNLKHCYTVNYEFSNYGEHYYGCLTSNNNSNIISNKKKRNDSDENDSNSISKKTKYY